MELLETSFPKDFLSSPLVLTCEHAGALFPPPLVAASNDSPWLATHWGYDIGAAELTRALAAAFGASLTMANFSRLICDTNRGWHEPSCIRHEVEGYRLQFNAGLSAAERERRRNDYYELYHRAVDTMLVRRKAAARPFWLLSVHSFTARYLGQPRQVELGVLFDDRHAEAAETLAAQLAMTGRDTRLNEPYSGRAGLIYSAQRHGRRHRVPYIELEVRQDLIDRPERAQAIASELVPALRRWLAEGACGPRAETTKWCNGD